MILGSKFSICFCLDPILGDDFGIFGRQTVDPLCTFSNCPDSRNIDRLCDNQKGEKLEMWNCFYAVHLLHLCSILGLFPISPSGIAFGHFGRYFDCQCRLCFPQGCGISSGNFLRVSSKRFLTWKWDSLVFSPQRFVGSLCRVNWFEGDSRGFLVIRNES